MTNELEVAKPRSMMIQNLCPGLAEIGKIKIGNKGAVRESKSGTEWQPPQKLDHFLITTMERGADGNFVLDARLHQRFGENPKAIPVRMIYDDIALNFATRYICYYGKTVFCSGDGVVAMRLQADGTYAARQCPCGRQDPRYNGDDSPHGKDEVGGKNGKGKCKINGILSALIEGAEMVGGVWKFRTTSYNTVVGILSSLALISRITGGRLAGIPLLMTVTPKTVQDPLQGKQQTIYVVGLQYQGTVETLRGTGYQIAMDEAKHGISMQQIEQQARAMLTHTPASGFGDDLDEEVIKEFYPEEAVAVHTGTVETVTGTKATQEDTVTPPARERGKAAPGKTRRTKEEVEEDRLADEADYKKSQEIKTTDEPLTTERAGLNAPPENVNTETGEIQDGEPVFVDDREQEPEYQAQEPGEPATGPAGDEGDIF